MARTYGPKESHSRPRLTQEQKARRAQNFQELTKDITNATSEYQDLARQLASKHRRTIAWTKNQLYLSGRATHQKHRVNNWNAFVKNKFTEANEGRGSGDRWKLCDFMKAHAPALKKAYYTLSQAQKKALHEGLSSVRMANIKVIRSNPKAIQKDAESTFKNMTNEWIGICSRLSMQGFFVAVRGSPDHTQEPKMFCTQGAENFIREILKQEPDNLALKFEAWVINKVDERPHVAERIKLPAAIRMCRNLIQEGLDRILEKTGKKRAKKISMNYENYECQIVEKLSVDLVEWPGTKFANPGSIGRENVFKLLDALQGGTCHWVALSPAELTARKETNRTREANGEQVYKPKKPRQTHARRAPKSAEDVVDTESESESESE